jgi:tetratricopeptide (TPR) repeat protein
VQLMPRIRIGPEGSPATLGHPIFFPLGPDKRVRGAKVSQGTRAPQDEKPAVEVDLEAGQYTQIVERVYSSVATEIYRRLDSDVREKTKLFPTASLRILALCREAEDFARSNTVDAYDRAIGFYRQALHHYERIEIKLLSKWILKFPWLFWRTQVRFQHDRARVLAGYAKCMVFRHALSTQSGRSKNPLYAVPGLLGESIQTLGHLQRHITRQAGEARLGRLLSYIRYPSDKWFTPLMLRPGERAFDIQRKVLFDLYLASALVQRTLDCNERALKNLENAAATAPDLMNVDSLYVLLKGLTEPMVDKALVYFRQAAELAPTFQMAQWYLAKTLERVFRELDELVPERAQPVLKAYEAVNALNYGNIGALYARGYLFWLIGELERARGCLEEGRQVKVVSRETFTGELSYGLARIAAETGRFEECRTLYLEGITTEPALGTVSSGRTSQAVGNEFENMGNSMLERYKKYKERVVDLIRAYQKYKAKRRESIGPFSISDQTLKVVQGFVLNDHGNACLRHFHQHGDQASLEQAIEDYRKAEELNPLDARPTYNLQNAYSWNKEYDKADRCFEQAGQLSPGWTSLSISAALERVTRYTRELRDKEKRWREFIEERSRAASQGDKEEEKWQKLNCDDAEKLVKEWSGNVSEAREMAFQRIRESSRFAGILAAEGIGTLEKVRYLARIPWRKLEERDVELQIGLAQLLATRANAQELMAAEILWSRLIEMLPEDYEVVSGLRATVRQLCKARAAFLVIKHSVVEQNETSSVPEEIQKFASRTWWDMEEREVDLLIQLSNLFERNKNLDEEADMNADREAVTALLAHLFGISATQKDLVRGVTAWEAKSSALRREFVSKIAYPESAGSRLLFRLAEKQYRKILLGWLRNETRNFLAHSWAAEFAAELEKRGRSRAYRQAEEIKREFFGDGWNHLRKEIEGWVNFQAEKYDKAKDSFLDLINHKPEEPGYRYCLGLCSERIQDWHGAVNAYQSACRLAPKKALYRKGLASAYNQIGHTARSDDAADKYGEAVRQAPDEAVYHYHLALALEQAGLPDSQGGLEKACEAMRRAHRLASTKTDYEQELRRLETRRNAYYCYGPARFMQFRATVTPLAVEYGAVLKSFIQDGFGSGTGLDLNQRSRNFQHRIRNNFGVSLPPARWIAREDELPPERYALMFNEMRLVRSGEVQSKKRFCLKPPSKLFEYPEVWRMDMPPDPITRKQTDPPRVIPASDPLTGEQGAWIDEGAFDSETLKRLELFDALDFVLRHLEAIVLSRLQYFLTHQDVVDRLRSSQRSQVRAIEESSEQVDALADALKARLAKRKPIEPFDELCYLFLTEGWSGLT